MAIKNDLQEAINYLGTMQTQNLALEKALRSWKPEEADGYKDEAQRFDTMRGLMLEYQKVLATALVSARLYDGGYWCLHPDKIPVVNENLRDSLQAAMWRDVNDDTSQD